MTTVALGDVCEVTTGQSAPQDADAFGESGTPFVRAGSLERLCAGANEDTLELIAPDKAQRYRLKLYPVNTVVFPKSGMSAKVGRVHRLRKDCHLVSHLAAVLPSEKVDPTFLYRWFEYSPPSRLIENDAYPSIKTSALEKIRIPLLPFSEQRRIATILDKADALRAKRREAIAKLDQLLQSVFLDMFGDPVTNPKGWETPAFGEIMRVKSGNGLTAQDMAPEGEFSVYGGNGVSGYHDEYMFAESQIVIGRVGVYCGAVHLTRPKSWVTDNALYVSKVLRPLDQTFLKAILIAANLNQYAGRAAQPLVSGSRIYPVSTILPPLAKQREYAEIAAKVEQQERVVQRHSEQLDTLFASLQHRAFTGTL